MLVEVTSMIASFGCSIFGSGTCSTLTSRLPCQVTAFTSTPFAVSWVRGRYPGTGRQNAPAVRRCRGASSFRLDVFAVDEDEVVVVEHDRPATRGPGNAIAADLDGNADGFAEV